MTKSFLMTVFFVMLFSTPYKFSHAQDNCHQITVGNPNGETVQQYLCQSSDGVWRPKPSDARSFDEKSNQAYIPKAGSFNEINVVNSGTSNYINQRTKAFYENMKKSGIDFQRSACSSSLVREICVNDNIDLGYFVGDWSVAYQNLKTNSLEIKRTKVPFIFSMHYSSELLGSYDREKFVRLAIINFNTGITLWNEDYLDSYIESGLSSKEIIERYNSPPQLKMYISEPMIEGDRQWRDKDLSEIKFENLSGNIIISQSNTFLSAGVGSFERVSSRVHEYLNPVSSDMLIYHARIFENNLNPRGVIQKYQTRDKKSFCIPRRQCNPSTGVCTLIATTAC